MTGEVFREFEQLISAQLAVAVGIEMHRVFDQTLGRGSARHSASWSIGSVAATTSETARAGSVVVWRTASVSSRTAGSSLVGTIGTGTIRAASTSPAFGRTAPFSFGGTGRPQFVFTEFTVAVLVEFFERSRSVGDLLGRKDMIVVGVECLHQRARWRTLPSVS